MRGLACMEGESRAAKMLIARDAGGDRQVGVAQHVASMREVQMLGGVSAAVALEARDDRFTHFRGGPQVVIAAGNQQDRSANIFHSDCGALHSLATAQPGAK